MPLHFQQEYKMWFDTFTYADIARLTGYSRRRLQRDLPKLRTLPALYAYIKERRSEIRDLARVLLESFEGDEAPAGDSGTSIQQARVIAAAAAIAAVRARPRKTRTTSDDDPTPVS